MFSSCTWVSPCLWAAGCFGLSPTGVCTLRGVKEIIGVFYGLPAAKPLSVLRVKKDDHFMEGSPSLLTSFLVVFALCPSVAAAPANQAGGERRAVRGELKLPHQWAWGKPGQRISLSTCWGCPWSQHEESRLIQHRSPAEEQGRQQQRRPIIMAEPELGGTTSEAGEKEQPLSGWCLPLCGE